MASDTPSFDLGFLDGLAWMTLGAAVIVGGLGFAVSDDIAFAIGCVLAASADVSLVLLATRRARRGLEVGLADPVSPVLMTAARVVLKAGLLLLAVLLHHAALFWGTVAGAIAFDVVLATAGSAMALTRLKSHSIEGR